VSASGHVRSKSSDSGPRCPCSLFFARIALVKEMSRSTWKIQDLVSQLWYCGIDRDGKHLWGRRSDAIRFATATDALGMQRTIEAALNRKTLVRS
jgi:hypothetical protein